MKKFSDRCEVCHHYNMATGFGDDSCFMCATEYTRETDGSAIVMEPSEMSNLINKDDMELPFR